MELSDYNVTGMCRFKKGHGEDVSKAEENKRTE